MRKYYSCSVGEEGKGYDEKNLSKIIENKAFILHENTPQKGDYQNIKKNDILLLKYRGQFVAYGAALEILKSSDEEWNLFAPVKEWFFHNSSQPGTGPEIYGMKNATLGGSQYGTVKPLEENFSIKKILNIDDETDLYKTLKIEQQKHTENKNMQDKIDILEYKKQIILQGPPGTGKTRMAKMIAEEMTKAEKILTPFEYIEYFIKNYNESSQINKYNEFVTEKLSEFTEEFPKDSIINLSLDQYCLGKGSTNSFCYWIEKGLKEVGRFSTGAAGTTVYGVYYSKDESKYISIIEDKNPDEAIVIIREALSDLVLNENYIKARKLFRFSFILKILNSYYPNNYFPIVSQKHLLTVARIFGLDSTGLNDIEINKKIKDKFIELKNSHNSSISSYNLMEHLYQKFKIKDDKIGNTILNEIVEIGETQLIQFHPAYSYEDFVRGIVVQTNKENQIEYVVVNRTIAAFAEKALKDQNGKYVLIIDEINRANLPSVLGELIYALEYRYNFKKENYKEAAVDSLYDRAKIGEESDKILMLPDNLYIIGTMNTSDRSVGHIDYAIRRRFAFVNVLPDIEPISAAGINKFKSVCELFIEEYDAVDWKNPQFKPSKYISSEFKPEDVMVGHSYFITKEKDDDDKPLDEIKQIELKLKYEIVPILKEYVKDGILKQSKEIETLISNL